MPIGGALFRLSPILLFSIGLCTCDPVSITAVALPSIVGPLTWCGYNMQRTKRSLAHRSF